MKMKQTMKRFLAGTLAAVMLLTLPVTTKAQAAVKDNLPEKVRVYTSSIPWSKSVSLTLEDTDKSIENVKSDSKNLKAELVGSNKSIQRGNVFSHSFTIGMIPFKDGVYTVTYDIVKNDKVIDTRKMKVYAYPTPLKDVKLDGKTDNYYADKAKAKIKVSLTSGNTIKKLEVGTFKIKTIKNSGQKLTNKTYKTFKNGDFVKLGTIGSYNEYSHGNRIKDDDYSGSLSSTLVSQTEIRITYKDKYTKQEETITRNFYGLAK